MPKGHEKEVSRTSQNLYSDSIKDSQDVSNVLLILDSTSIRTNPFGANVSGDNSYRRAERISAALHLLTNHVPEEEPIRLMLRNKGLELLSLILEMRSGFRGPASEKGQSVLASIRELISLSRLLAVSGYISAQNANVIAEALDELGSLTIISQRSTLAEQLTISHEQLIPPASQNIRMNRSSSAAPARKSASESVPTERIGGGVYADRSERIIEILKAGGLLGIRDIISNLPQYSEKMIQRELAEMTIAGRVQKIGAKRWSRYRLTQPNDLAITAE